MNPSTDIGGEDGRGRSMLDRFGAQMQGILFQFRLDPDGKTSFPYLGGGVLQKYGIVSHDARVEDADTVLRVVHPEDLSGLLSSMRESARTLVPWRYDFRAIQSDGRTVWRSVEAMPERLPDGAVLWHGHTLDIDRIKRAEEALRENEERWKMALEGAGHGVWDWNLVTGETLYSSRWKAILGFAEDEIGNHAAEWMERVHPEDMPRLVESQAQIARGVRPSDSVEFRLRCKDGRWKWVLGSGILVGRDAAGNPLRMVGTCSDIDARRQAEDQLRLALAELDERRREAESLSEAKSRFLNAASHDLRQPLYAAQLFVEALGSGALTTAQHESLRNLELSISAMSAQLQMLLDFSRLDMGNIRPQPGTVPIAGLFRNLETTYAPVASKTGTGLRFHAIAGDIHSDPTLTMRLIDNLIDNAIKFSPEGHILVCARRCAQGVRIEVRDSGPGIAPEFRQRIFDEYYQIENPARDAQAGLGLGLAIALRIARLLDAPFELRTQIGKGSIFSVTLPLAPPEAST